MSHSLVVTPKSPGTTDVVVPDGGDPRTAASVDTPMSSIWAAVLWLYKVLITGEIAQGITVNGFIGTVANDITADGNVVATQDVIADRDVHAFRNLHIEGSAQVDGSSAVTGQLVVGSNTILNGNLTVAGAVSARIVRPLVNTSTSLTAALGTDYYVPSLSTGITITLPASGAVAGDEINISTASNAHTVAVNAPGGSLIANLIYPDGSDWGTTGIPIAFRRWAKFKYTSGGTWVMFAGPGENVGG